jgi:hypothetical protein
MTITIEPTGHLVDLDGVQCRLWEGTTDQGVKCKVFVLRVAVHKDEDQSAFEHALKTQLPPGRAISLRQVL